MARPADREQCRRRKAFLRSLDEYGSFAEAASASKLSATQLVRLLDEDEFWAVAAALRAGRVSAVAVTAAPEPSRSAAA